MTTIIQYPPNQPPQLFETPQLTWYKNPSIPFALQDCSIVYVEKLNKIVLINGFCSGDKTGSIIYSSPQNKINYQKKITKFVRGFSNKLYQYDETTKKWQLLTTYPAPPRASLSAICIDTKIYCWGGYSFTPSDNLSQQQHPPPPKTNLKAYKDGYFYDLILNKWEKLPDLPTPLTNFNMCQVSLTPNNQSNQSNQSHTNSHYIYIFGGSTFLNNNNNQNTQQVKNTLYQYDIHTKQFTLLPPPPLEQATYRMDASLTYHNNFLYVIGGIYPNPHWNYTDKQTIPEKPINQLQTQTQFPTQTPTQPQPINTQQSITQAHAIQQYLRRRQTENHQPTQSSPTFQNIQPQPQPQTAFITNRQPKQPTTQHKQQKNEPRYSNIKDNWKYDILNKQWLKIADNPFQTSNWATSQNQIYKNKILLIGGCYYYRTIKNHNEYSYNTQILNSQGKTNGEYEFLISDDIYTYDIITNTFEKHPTKLPFPINKPKWILINNKIHLCGGESIPAAGKYKPDGNTQIDGYLYENEFFGYHSDVYLEGRLQ